MRVVSGSRRGAKLLTRENEEVRPTTDRVKESMFNLIGDFVRCETVLDLFAGSGALSIESVSRGAKKAVCVDSSNESMKIIKKNYENLRLTESAEFHVCDALSFLKQSRDKYELIFLDPPYNQGLIAPAMGLIRENRLLSEKGIIVMESDCTDVLPDFFGVCIFKQRRYGRTVVTLYENEVENQ